MRKILFSFCLLLLCSAGYALDRQPVADYHVRREALAKKAGGLVVLLAPLEGMDSVYEFRQENNFYYLSGVTVPGAGLLIAPAVRRPRRCSGSSRTRRFCSCRRAICGWKSLPARRWVRIVLTLRK